MAVARFERLPHASQSGEAPHTDAAHLETFARQLFQSLWRLDFLAMAIVR
jgi:hypothetical protein